ncbi:ABC-F family ATP-binding cassette domain-containing protein [Alkalihalobacillus macyae]|uniref:ABC-F family ATP-binding cassette domain-containing protein n=1 Tax=Guptibacillus hwajinpoensis TaxID=208199 RepID=UPI00273CD3F6|nr:ABC-F family ATP-binding cassette domain-containing protein [Alkalihalobacillus macyae]MDP4553586.1 ABC-F family ATP-binding cassette domain-containing protein [Alkalihalobacillus macyae]
MIVLQVNGLTKSFGADTILSNIKLEVQSRDRVALVGRNGAGKSTLLKMITGQLSYDSGDIIKPKDVSIGYMAQDTGLESNLSIWEEMLGVFDRLRKMEDELRRYEKKMGNPEIYENETEYQRILKEYDELQVAFKDQGGYKYEADIRTVLHGLNFKDFDTNTKISTLSGGQKTRLALGKLLLTKPELLILDEPTNHLDIETLTWLEGYLQNYSGALLIVSHDRYFLDKIVTKVYEVSRHRAERFEGNYSYYLDEKDQRFEQQMREFDKQQKEIAKLEEFVQKNIVRASTTKRAQSRRKQLERMDRIDKPKGDEKSANISFSIDKQTGNDVLTLRELAIGYPTNIINQGLTFDLKRQESVALVGPNGIGKSTLLKAIVSGQTLLDGDIHYGSNVKIGFYDQEQTNLTSNKTVLKELWDDFPLTDEKDVRAVLGRFLFTGDDVLKNVSDLSGGEKGRLALSKLMMQKSNLLILDEPTNHLDLDSKEILEEALIQFPGTILFVSHDRYFINRIATRVLELSTDGVTAYLGDYDYYVEKKQELAELAALEQQASQPEQQVTSGKTSFQQDKETKRQERQMLRRLEEIEKEVDTAENRMAALEEELCLPEVFEDHEKVMKLNEEMDELRQKAETLMEEWEQLQEA